MHLEILNLGGYGQFVWPAFIFTFISCLTLYIKTRKELKKQEKIFSRDFIQIKTIEIKTTADKPINKESIINISV